MIKWAFDRFDVPLVYTRATTNEWTTVIANYNPLDRLAKVRAVFFPRPDKTLGQTASECGRRPIRGSWRTSLTAAQTSASLLCVW
jgi:hypothetical protein